MTGRISCSNCSRVISRWYLCPSGSVTPMVVDGFVRERNLGIDNGVANQLYGLAMMPKIEAEVALNIVERNGNQQIVDVVAAEMRIAVGGHDFENAVAQLEDRNVECAATQIVDGDGSVLLLVEAVSERSGSWFVHQAQHIETSDAARIFRRLPLCVVKVGGNGNHRLFDRTAEEALGIALELAQDVGGNFRRSVSCAHPV